MITIPTTKLKKTTPGIILFLYAGNIDEQIKAFPVSASLRRLLKQARPIVKTDVGTHHTLLMQNGRSYCIVVGAGKKANMTDSVYNRALRAGIRAAKDIKLERVSLLPPESGMQQSRIAYLVSMQGELALYSFGKYKKEPKPTLKAIEVVIKKSEERFADIKKEVARGKIIGEEINNARELSNTPGGDMTPTLLAQHAQKDGMRAGFSVRVFGEKKLQTLKLGGIIGVSRGSSEEPQFILCEYKPRNAVNKKPLVFVGKGVTFDTGGLNLKAEDGMNEMHMDMSGGASVIHALAAIARLRIPVHVVALIPAVENMPGSSGYRPGDILRVYNGKTVEVKNTDAEGRIILADALSYAKVYDPEVIIDLATLTGSAMGALGQRASALLTNDQELEEALRIAGELSGDRVWPLPFWPEYTEDVKGEFGDIANLGKTRYGGAITAGAFLREFAPIKKWAHIDIAPTMTAIPEDHLAKGSKGTGVYLLTLFTERYAEGKK